MSTPIKPTPLNFRKATPLSNPHSQFLYAASGPVSGEGYFASAMYIQTQGMTIDYERVPEGYMNWFVPVDAQSSFHLSSIVVSGSITNTYLRVRATAWADAQIVSGMSWESSSYHQDQTFLVDSTSSLNGINYGSVADGNLGPAGKVFNPVSGYHYQREALPHGFDPADYDVYYEGPQTIYNYSIIVPASSCEDPNYPYATVDNFNKPQDFFDMSTKLGNLWNFSDLCGKKVVGTVAKLGTELPGPYSTSQDDPHHVYEMVTACGLHFQYGSGEFVDGQNNAAPMLPHYNAAHHTWN